MVTNLLLIGKLTEVLGIRLPCDEVGISGAKLWIFLIT